MGAILSLHKLKKANQNFLMLQRDHPAPFYIFFYKYHQLQWIEWNKKYARYLPQASPKSRENTPTWKS